MNTRIRELLGQIGDLEDELRRELHQRQAQVHFTIEVSPSSSMPKSTRRTGA